MIRIQSNRYLGFHQIDSSYTLPSITGAVQWNGSSKSLEVSTGHGWIPIDNTVDLSSNIDIGEVVAWAHSKMLEEQKQQELRNKYPALDEAYKNLEFVKGIIGDI